MLGLATSQHAIDEVVLVACCIARFRRWHPVWCDPADQQSRYRSAQYDPRKRYLQGEDGDEGNHCKRKQESRLQGALSNAQQSLDHDCQHGGLEAEEKRRYQRQLTEANVEIAQESEHQCAGQHEQKARNDAAPGPMHQPANIDRELLCLGSGQQHAVVQRMQETWFADPASLFDQLTMHQCYLSGRPTKTEPADARPDASGSDSLRKGDVHSSNLRFVLIAHIPVLRPGTYICRNCGFDRQQRSVDNVWSG
jgi:hypothetical protein